MQYTKHLNIFKNNNFEICNIYASNKLFHFVPIAFLNYIIFKFETNIFAFN
jgi:hypothetical protein